MIFLKKIRLLTKEQHESYKNAKICYICKEKLKNKYLKDKKYRKVRVDYHYTGEYSGVSKKNFIVFHNGSNYDYHFIIKKLAEEFRKQCTCLGESTEKYIAFKFPIEKEVARINKNGEEITKIHLTCYNLLIAPDLWQAHSQILSIIFLKEFIELNVNMDKYDDKKCET